MAGESAIKRTVVFIDGQNLFHCARNAFGYTFPNFEPKALASRVCAAKTWQLDNVRFYTGVPDATDNAFWSKFWAAKLLAMSRQGVTTFSRPLRYRNKKVRLPDGSVHAYLSGEEKGVDVRIALDVISLAHRREYDVALIFSQDQDLSEVAEEVRVIANEQGRWIKVASAYPSSPAAANRRGINKTDWVPIDRATYDACIDPYDYRPKTNPAP
ncbi:MAG: NYN domain-containing protein [Betaproteobacteria bacterium RIFCSPLOWO2_02_FULL_62_17]|nr:MAG: NYN domain-containing protein [Betaproteobacteria bacterium RIFCSPLOWO2_02_FULL_62_17]